MKTRSIAFVLVLFAQVAGAQQHTFRWTQDAPASADPNLKATTWRADAERCRPTAADKIRLGTWLLLVVEGHDESIMIGTGLEMVQGTVPASGVVPRSNELVVS